MQSCKFVNVTAQPSLLKFACAVAVGMLSNYSGFSYGVLDPAAPIVAAGHMESDPDSLAMANFIASIEESDVESDSDTEDIANDSESVEFTSSSFSFSLSNILQAITEDELVSSSTHGASVLQIVEYLQTMLDSTPVVSFCSILLEELSYS